MAWHIIADSFSCVGGCFVLQRFALCTPPLSYIWIRMYVSWSQSDGCVFFPGLICFMQVAVARANELQKPWILDPVGVGATTFRTEKCIELIHSKPTVIRGNASEIMAVVGASTGSTKVNLQSLISLFSPAFRVLICVVPMCSSYCLLLQPLALCSKENS